MEDNKIIDLFFSRNENAIKETANKYSALCYKISYNILNNHQDSQECVNDTYLKVWETIPPKKPNVFSAFLSKITRNLSLDMYKKYHAKKRWQGEIELTLSELNDCIPSRLSTETQLNHLFLTETLNEFLKNLSHEKRNIFIKRYWYFMSIKNIAEELNISQSKVKSILFVTRNYLKEILESEGVLL